MDKGLSSQKFADALRLSRATMYRRERRMRLQRLRGLEDRSRRPRWCRRPQWSPELSEAVQAYRGQFGQGRENLAVLLQRGVANLGFHRGSDPPGVEGARGAACTTTLRNPVLQVPCEAALHYQKAHGIRGASSRRPGARGHAGRTPAAECVDQADYCRDRVLRSPPWCSGRGMCSKPSGAPQQAMPGGSWPLCSSAPPVE